MRGNVDFLRQFLTERLPAVKLVEPQGTYLAWLDFSATGLTETERRERIVQRAKLWLDEGAMFGVGGEQFERINLACPRAVLERALEQLAAAFADVA